MDNEAQLCDPHQIPAQAEVSRTYEPDGLIPRTPGWEHGDAKLNVCYPEPRLIF